ncbi:hypothetical protein BsWGS_13082 [Bradybaena similaris]
MAASLSMNLVCRVSPRRHLLSPLVLSQTFITAKSPHLNNNAGQILPSRTFACTGTPTAGPIPSVASKQSLFTSTLMFPSHLAAGLQPDQPCICVPSRNYGRKMIQKKPKVTFFEYSGDLRKLPELDKNLILYKYRGIEDKLEGNELLRKLTTLEFASSKEISEHRKQLIKDRIVALFGPDSELEQKIAMLTLHIRLNIPRCIKYRSDKLNKTRLVLTIHHRRKLLTTLRSLDHERFEWLLRELKIRYVIPKDREEYKGWKHNKRVATQEEAREKQRKKLEQLKEKFEAEKKIFFEHKTKVISKIEEDLKKYGLDWDFLENLIKSEKEAKEALEKQQQQQSLFRPAPVKEPTTTAKSGKRT